MVVSTFGNTGPIREDFTGLDFTEKRSYEIKKMSNFHFDLSLKLSQGEMRHFSGQVQNDPRGGAHLSKFA